MSRPPAVSSFTAPLVVLLTTSWLAASPGAQREPLLDWFFDAASADDRVADAALGRLRGAWRDAYAAMLLDLARFTQPRGESVTVDVSGVTPRRDPQGLTHMPVYPGAQFATIERRLHPSAKVRARLLQFLRQHTGQRFGDDLGRWRQWTWQLPYQPHAEYLAFKAQVSAGAVPMTAAFFTEGDAAFRLDEVDWTGRDPAHVPAPGRARHDRVRRGTARANLAGPAGAPDSRVDSRIPGTYGMFVHFAECTRPLARWLSCDRGSRRSRVSSRPTSRALIIQPIVRSARRW